MNSSQRFELIFTTLLKFSYKIERDEETQTGYNLYIKKELPNLSIKDAKFKVGFFYHLLDYEVSECIILCGGFCLASIAGFEGSPNFGKIHRLENIIEGYYLTENPQDADIDLPEITKDNNDTLLLIEMIGKHIETLINHSK